MADTNRNRNSQNWDSSNNRRRNQNQFNEENRDQENYDSYGNAGFREDQNRNFDQYRNEQDRWRNQVQGGNEYGGQYYGNRQVNYTPDHDDNRDYKGGWNNGGEQQWSQSRNQHWQGRRSNEDNRQWQASQRRSENGGNQDWERNRGSSNYDSKQWASGNYGDDRSSSNSYEGRDYGNYRYGKDDQRHIDRLRNEDQNAWGRESDQASTWLGYNSDQRRSEGQTGEHRGKGPRGYQRSKERIHEDICDRLTYDDRLDASEIDVKVEDNEVILSGTVTTREEKRRAEDIAESISGVRNVQNRLKLTPPDVGTTETTNTIIRKAGNMPDQDAERL